MNKKLVVIISSILAVLLILTLIFVYISFEKTAVINPISSLNGILNIVYTEEKYVVVQNSPYKVIFSKPIWYGKTAQELLDDYMSERGFTHSDRLGGLLIYTNGTDEERIHFSVNGYCSIWEWV